MATTEKRIEAILQRYPLITLDEMKDVRLMNRIDTKFVATITQLEELLRRATDDYLVQSIEGRLLSDYHTVYYDTADHRMFYSHQAGHLWRQKIRFRTYVDSQLSFLEIKTKDNHRRTKKKRIKTAKADFADKEQRDFVLKHLLYDIDSLQPTLENRFQRITLVNTEKTERLTIDINLNIKNLENRRCDCRDRLVIIELKRDGLLPSPVLPLLRQLRIKPHGFSKYCMGQTMTADHLRINRMKEKLHYVEKLLQQNQ